MDALLLAAAERFSQAYAITASLYPCTDTGDTSQLTRRSSNPARLDILNTAATTLSLQRSLQASALPTTHSSQLQPPPTPATATTAAIVLSRLKTIFHSNDPRAKVLAIAFVTATAPLLPLTDSHLALAIYHEILPYLSFDTPNQLPSAIRAFDVLASRSTVIASRLSSRLLQIIKCPHHLPTWPLAPPLTPTPNPDAVQISSNLAAPLIRMSRHMHQNPDAAYKTRATLLSILPTSTRHISKAIIQALTFIAMKNLLHTSIHISLLISLLPSSSLHSTALTLLGRMSSTLGVGWTKSHVTSCLEARSKKFHGTYSQIFKNLANHPEFQSLVAPAISVIPNILVSPEAFTSALASAPSSLVSNLSDENVLSLWSLCIQGM